MDKILPILEKHVQWIALGIGALFLLLMAYSYVVKQPVTVPLGGQQVVPGEVDEKIQNGSNISELKRQMSEGAPKPPELPRPSEQLAKVVNAPIAVPDINVGPQTPGNPTSKPVPASIAIPSVPKPTFAFFSMGRGLYQWPKHQPPATAPAGAPVAPPPPMIDPGSVAVQMDQRDLDWWTGSFNVNLVQLAEAFKAAEIDLLDPNVAKTAFLGAELIRQEKQLDGSWGPETKIGVLPEFIPLMRPLPAETAPQQQKAEYMFWAAQYVQMLIQPTFPQVIAGDPWYVPGTEAPPKVNQLPQGMPVEGEVGPGLRPPPMVRPPVVPRAAPGQPGFVDPDLNPRGPGGFVNPGAGFTPDESGGVGGYAPPQMGDASAIPGAGNAETGGTFNPGDYAYAATQQGLQDYPVTVYGHDITIQPNKTYRYKLRYIIRNPLFLLGPPVKPEYAGKLALFSAFSEWSPDVSVPPRVEFWVQAVTERPGQPAEAAFNVFVARNDRWEPVKVSALPGDQIARGEANSGWSLVDVRKGPDGKHFVLLSDTNGRIERRDLEKDQNDPRQRELSGVPEVVAPPEGIESPPTEGGTRIPPPPGRRPPPRGFTPDE